MACRGVRGATTVTANTKEAVTEATREVLEKIIEANGIAAEDVAYALFTTTRDVNAEFPAVAARLMGWDKVALMCGHEMDVPDATKGVIRVMVLWNTGKRQDEIVNIYLRGAAHLRQRGMEGQKGASAPSANRPART